MLKTKQVKTAVNFVSSQFWLGSAAFVFVAPLDDGYLICSDSEDAFIGEVVGSENPRFPVGVIAACVTKKTELQNALKKLAADEFEFELDFGGKLVIKSDCSRLLVDASKTTVKIPEVADGKDLPLGGDWRRWFSLAALFADKDDTRPILSSVKVVNGRVFSTDGTRAIIVPICALGWPDSSIPANVMRSMPYLEKAAEARYSEDKAGDIAINTILFSDKFRRVYARLDKHHAPDYEKLLAINSPLCATFSAKAALKAVSSLKKSSESALMEFIKDDYGNDADADSGSVVLSNITGETHKIKAKCHKRAKTFFSPYLMVDFLMACGEQDVSVYYSSGARAIVMSTQDGVAFFLAPRTG